MTENSTLKKISKPLILVATIIWGSSFMLTKDTLDMIPTFYLLAFRFSASAVVLGLVFWKRWKRMDRRYLLHGSIMGALLFAGYAFQTTGLSLTTSGKTAFLTAVYCVIVPFLYWVIARKKPDRYNIIAAVLCVGGIGFVSLNGNFTINFGDLMVLVGGFFFAAHIVAVSKYAEGRDIFLLTVLQFVSFAVLAWIFALIFAGPVPVAALNQKNLLIIGYLVIFGSCAGLLFQNIGQKYTEPATAAVLLALEAPFGVIFSVLFASERPTLRMFLGFALIFAAVICSETKFKFLKKKVDIS